MNRRRLTLALSAALFIPTLLLAPVVYGYVEAITSRQDAGRDASPMIGKALPAFSLMSRDGRKMTHADFTEGRYVFNIFASWCSYCVYEHPIWMEINDELPNAQLVGVAWSDADAATGRWLEKNGNPYDTVLNDSQGALAVALGVGGAPESFLIDNGVIVGFIEGMAGEEDKETLLKPFLTDTPEPAHP